VGKFIKFWKVFRANPASSIAFIGLLALFLMIPWPIGGVVRALLRFHDPACSEHIQWDKAFLQPSSGLLFTGFSLNPSPELKIRAKKLRVTFSWPRLLFLQPQVEEIHADKIDMEWQLFSKNPDARLDYAIPTESHLANAKQALDSLRPILSANQIQMEARLLRIFLGQDTFQIENAQIQVAPHGLFWELSLSADGSYINDWPLPNTLDARLDLQDSCTEVQKLKGCWTGGCLVAKGTLGNVKTLSELEMEANGVPLKPFGEFVLPKGAVWKGNVKATIHWKGRIAHPNTWVATGEAELSDVQFLRWPFQKEGTFASSVPQLKERLLLDEIQIPKFALSKGRVKMDSMSVSSDQIQATAKGAWTFPQRLDFRLNGEIEEELYVILPKLTRLALPKSENGGGKFKATLSGTFNWQAIIPDSEHYGTAFRNLFN
jgi:hypothetical protein